MKKTLRILLAGSCISIIKIQIACSASATTIKALDFGTITQISDNVLIVMDTNGNANISGGIKSGSTSVAEGAIIADAAYKSERIEELSFAPGAPLTPEGRCKMEIINPTLGISDNKFSIAPSDSLCHWGANQIPESYSIPVSASLKITEGYCPEGTYTIGITVSWNEMHCNSIVNCFCTDNIETKSDYISATVTIKSSLSVQENQSLDFGTIIAMPQPQSIKMSTTGQRSGSVSSQYDTTGHQGIFKVTGAPGYQVNVNVPSSAVIQNSNGTPLNVTLVTDATSLMLNESGGTGMATFSVGGTLEVNANQDQGDYQGTYTVGVNY